MNERKVLTKGELRIKIAGTVLSLVVNAVTLVVQVKRIREL